MTLSLGLDIGGTKIAAALVDQSGAVRETNTVSTFGRGAGVVDQVATLVASHARKNDIRTVGLAVPGGVDPVTGRVIAAPNLGSSDVDLATAMCAHVTPEVVVRIHNDANARRPPGD